MKAGLITIFLAATQYVALAYHAALAQTTQDQYCNVIAAGRQVFAELNQSISKETNPYVIQDIRNKFKPRIDAATQNVTNVFATRFFQNFTARVAELLFPPFQNLPIELKAVAICPSFNMPIRYYMQFTQGNFRTNDPKAADFQAFPVLKTLRNGDTIVFSGEPYPSKAIGVPPLATVLGDKGNPPVVGIKPSLLSQSQ